MWKPIETAPKDGTRFLAWGGAFNNLPYILAWEPSEYVPDRPWKVVQTTGRIFEHVPKFWMSLPPPREFFSHTATFCVILTSQNGPMGTAIHHRP